MKPGSPIAVNPSMEKTKITKRAVMTTNAQDMCEPR